jgi:iron complex outermembrane receptor protein
LAAALLLGAPAWAGAAEDAAKAEAPQAAEDPPYQIDEVVVYGQYRETLGGEDYQAPQLIQKSQQSQDTASLFKDAPAVSLGTGGAISSLPSVHGLADDRVKILVNGMNLTSACSNHMNPALSYIAPANVGQAKLMAGLTPVSQGGDSIGGAITVDPLSPLFATAQEGTLASGRLSSFYRSVNDNVGVAANASWATQRFSLDYNGSWSKARNYYSGDDGPPVVPTRYQATNHYLRAAAKLGNGLWSVDVAGQHQPYQGFPNQRMDLVQNDAVLGGLAHESEYGWGKLDARLYFHHSEHTMDTLPERKTAHMLMNTDGVDLGYRLRAHVYLDERNTVHVGNEYHRQMLEDWWPGKTAYYSNPMDFLSINNGERNRMGTFAEWQADWSPAWLTLIGARNDVVWMNAGQAHGYDTGFFSTFWADQFNARDHARTDVNFDVTALARYTPNAWGQYELGFARKMRAPNLYERYAWYGHNSMVSWFGDGNGYQGNLDLKSETAYQFSFTAAWHDPDEKIWSLNITPYYTHVSNYIWGQTESIDASGFRGMRFVNLDHADLYGVDAAGRYAFLPESPAGSFALRASLAYVRGVGQDGGRGQPCPFPFAAVCAAQGWPAEGLQAPGKVNLYHIMPLRGSINLEQQIQTDWGQWSNLIGVDLVSRKNTVAKTYGEPQTAGYALLNVRTGFQYKKFHLDTGVDNLLDKRYFHPLGGVDIVATYAQGYPPPKLLPVAALGRSVYVTMSFDF